MHVNIIVTTYMYVINYLLDPIVTNVRFPVDTVYNSIPSL
jgi:hypothetical protein